VFATDDTIVAIATPPGRGGIGIVRISGPRAHGLACRLLGRVAPLEPRRATIAHNVETDGPSTPVDQVIATYFAAPHSYTGQDVVELGAHGSPLLLTRVLELSMAGGARLAEPGEFTLRAYLNGRMDLIQAEAVADLVNAVTPLQARAAMDQLEGTLTGAIGGIERRVFDLTAQLEASLDFPEEGFHFVTRDETRETIESISQDLDLLIVQGDAGRVVREGSLVVIVGAPNAGKSSLFNALVGSARAIVTDMPGTTRDVLSETVDIGGLALTMVDTAGIREATDAIEAEGIRRAMQARQIAALTLVVIDASVPFDATGVERLVPRETTRKVVVLNKNDCPPAWDPSLVSFEDDEPVAVSATTGSGLPELRRRIVRELTTRDEWRDPPVVSNMRHIALLREAGAALAQAITATAAGATEELVIAELSAARTSLEAITGRTTADDVLHHIFSRFCIGK
jgi:tRNA modification GTPase